MQITTLADAEKFLKQFIPETTGYHQGTFGLDRTRYLLKLLDNPQDKIKTIHIAGTSGKGSTAYFTSILLKSQGFKVGLHLSPHLLDIRERMEINNQFISEEQFIQNLTGIIPFILEMKNSEYGHPTYFEILTALAFYTFWKEKVNYAVIETGIGGLYDATNSIQGDKKFVILTRIGLDHMNILGNTIEKIAFQKAGIIKENNIVVSFDQVPQAKKVINEAAKKMNAMVYYIGKEFVENVEVREEGTEFTLSLRGVLDEAIPSVIRKDSGQARMTINLGAIGSYQAENCSLALATLLLLAKRDHFGIDPLTILQSLKTAHFAGRFEMKEINGKTVILDGAHNPQKMAAFTKNLAQIYPNKKFHFLVSFKSGKDHKNILKYIIPLAEKITITDFYLENGDLTHISEKSQEVKKNLEELGFGKIEIIKNPLEALKEVVKQNTDVVITGSLYFLSILYRTIPQ